MYSSVVSAEDDDVDDDDTAKDAVKDESSVMRCFPVFTFPLEKASQPESTIEACFCCC